MIIRKKVLPSYMLHKVIKGLRNYSYYTAACGYYMASFAKRMCTHTRARAHGQLEGSHREHPCSPVCAFLSVSAFAKGTGMRISPRDGRRKRRESSSPGRVDTGNRIDSANTHVCARARARTTDTCVHTRLRFDVCAPPPPSPPPPPAAAAAAALASIKAVRCLPRRGRRDSNLLGSPPCLSSPISPSCSPFSLFPCYLVYRLPLFRRCSQPRADISRDALRPR